jgi:hypothetical protein
LPVFTDLDHSNRLFVQKIAAGDVVERFEPIEIGDHSVTVYPEVIRVGPGERALWGFQFSSDTCVIGTREALHSQLYAIESELPPILRLQMARVFDEPVI